MKFLEKINEEGITKVLRKNLIYVLTLLYSIYTSYLICRLYILNIKGIVCISIVNILISMFLAYLWKKNVDFSAIKRKTKIIIFTITIIISAIVLLLNWNLLTYKFDKTSVTIQIENADINSALKNIVVNNISYDIIKDKAYNMNIGSDKNFIMIENKNIKVQTIDTHTLKIDFDKYIDIKIVLNRQEENISIQENNNLTAINFEDSTYTYNVTSNSFADNYYILRIFASFLAVIYVVGLLISTLVYINGMRGGRYYLITIIICAIGAWIYFKLFQLGALYPDSQSYISYYFSDVLLGKFKSRTPIYPLIIRICYTIFNDEYLYFVCVFQYIVYFISIIFLYKLLKLLIKNDKIVMLMTILYALCPAIIDWNNIILTESIALSGTVIFIYFIVKYIKEPKWTTGNFAIITALILTFHRPTSIIYVVFLLIFWIARFILDRKNIKVDFKCFIVSICSIVLIVIYAIIFKQTYGIYSITDRLPRQNLVVCIREGYYKKSNNEEFIKKVENAFENNKNSTNIVNSATSEILTMYSLDEVKEITGYCRLQCMPQYIRYLIHLNKDNLSILYDHYYYKVVDSNLIWVSNMLNKLFMFITFSHVYIVIGIELILLIYNWAKTKKVPWIHCGLFAFPLVIIESSFIGTNAEFMRTSLCVLPFTYVSIAMYIDMLVKPVKYKKMKSLDDNN